MRARDLGLAVGPDRGTSAVSAEGPVLGPRDPHTRPKESGTT